MTLIRGLIAESPIGQIILTSDGKHLTGISVSPRQADITACGEADREDGGLIAIAKQELEEYFSGERSTFSVPIKATGTPFQMDVWRELSEIPYGQTVSYGIIAERLGDQNLSRAVGTANGQNPLPIVIPCHRVIGADGSLTGYSGGIAVKRFLLNLESSDLSIPGL